MAQFKRIGGAYFRESDSGELFAVSDRETIQGLKAGQLPFNSVENTRGLTFGAPNSNAPKSTSAPAVSATSGSGMQATAPQQNDIGSLLKKKLIDALTTYKGATNVAELEERRQSLLRKQLLSAPYSSEGESTLTGAQKLSLLRSRGQEFEPEIKALEQQIIEKKNLPIQEMQTLSTMVSLAENLGLLDDKKLSELKISNPEIAFADTMEEALGYLGGEIKKDKALERRLKEAQINAANAAATAKNNPTETQLPSSQVVMLSDAKFLPGVLDELEKLVNDNKDLFGYKNVSIFGVGAAKLSDEKLKIDAELRRAAQLVGKFMEGGVLRKEDEIKYARMLPQIDDKNSDVALNKLTGVREMLGLKYNNYLVDFNGSNYDVSNFPLLDFSGENKEPIKVREKSSGQTGTIPIDEFDPALYEKIE